MDSTWRFPAARTPHAWVDRAGIVWLDSSGATHAGPGEVPARLWQVFDDYLTGRRNPEPGIPRRERRFDHTTWQVSVVHAHY